MSVIIGAKLKHLRKLKDLTQLEVAEKLGLGRATVSNYECGRRTPHLSDLRVFAEFYGVGLDYFGIEQQDEAFELAGRAASFFSNEHISKEEKEKAFKEIMKIYLKEVSD